MVATGGRSSADHRLFGGGLSRPTCVEAEEAGSVNRWVRLGLDGAKHGRCGEAAPASRTINSVLRWKSAQVRFRSCLNVQMWHLLGTEVNL